jgi:protein-disulfide isomerase
MARTSSETVVLRLLVVIFATLAGALGWYVARDRVADPSASLTPQQVETLIGQYLKDHPDMVVEAIREAQARAEQAKASESAAQLVDLKTSIFDNPADPVFGNPKGDVSLVEFFDYRCPYCKRVTPDVDALLAEDGSLKVVLKEYPILGPESLYAAKLAYAAFRQGRYREMHNALMSHRGDYGEATLLDMARGLGLDVQRLKSDLADPAIAGQVQANLDLGRALGIGGTPAFVIGRKVVPGAISRDEMKKLIAQARAEADAAP